MSKFFAPPVTPERLYLQDKRRQDRDIEEQRHHRFRMSRPNSKRRFEIDAELGRLRAKISELLEERRKL